MAVNLGFVKVTSERFLMDAPGVEAVVCVWRCVSVGLKLPYLAVIRPFIADINQIIEHQFHLNM